MRHIIFIVCIFLLFSCNRKTDKYDLSQDETVYSNKTINTSPQISFLNISSFCQDSLGYMWIGTLGGLNRYNGYEFQQFTHDESDSTTIDHDFVFSLFRDSSNRLWVGTSTGVNRYDFNGNGFERYKGQSAAINSFYEDKKGQLWAASSSGPCIVDTSQKSLLNIGSSVNTNLFWEDSSDQLWMGLSEDKGLATLKSDMSWEFFSLPQNRWVMSIYIDPQGIWWLGTNKGLILFDPTARKFIELPQEIKNNSKLNNTRINFIKEVEPLKILIGTATQGIFQYDILAQNLQHNKPHRFNSFNSTQLLSCYIDKNEDIWVGSFDKGFLIAGKYPEFFNEDHRLSDLFKDKFVTRIVEDNYSNLWVSTRYDGLYCYTKEGIKSIYNSNNSTIFPDNNDFLESLFIDSKNRMWIGFDQHLIICDVSENGKLNLLENLDVRHVRVVKEDSDGVFWLGTWFGVYRVDYSGNKWNTQRIYTSNVPDICILSDGQILFSSYGEGVFKIDKNNNTTAGIDYVDKLVVNRCVTIFEDSKKRIWFGSYGNGMMCASNDSLYNFSQNNGLTNNNVLSFNEDLNGDIWASTLNGISKIRITPNDTLISNYSVSDGIGGNQFHEKSGCKVSDGRIFFGGNHGLTFFNPAITLASSSPPMINLEDLKIFNQSVLPTSNSSVLKKSLSMTEEIILNHKQTTFSIDYSGIEFNASDKLTYKYKLENFDAVWNEVGTFRRAGYSNLPAGEYRFVVNAINRDGVEGLHPASLRIIVKPAPWLTWQAMFVYFLLFAAVLYLSIRFWLKIKLNRQLLEIEHNEREREKEISEMKINFFTNISHELRTPLTLISAPLEQLIASAKNDDNRSWLLSTIMRNVQNMLQLINQMLDFRRVENGVLLLQIQYVDIVLQIKNIYDAFVYLANRKNIEFAFISYAPELYVWVDTDKLGKILHNLLLNAFKFTPENGKVTISTSILDGKKVSEKYNGLKTSGNYLEIVVSDNGLGIDDDKMGELFIRYRQISGSSGIKPDYSGSGIGLHYTKSLVEKHKGSIIASKNPDSGLSFSFVLPIDDIYSDDLKISGSDISVEDTESPVLEYFDNPNKQEKHTILLVEDNFDLMDFMRNLLHTDYNILEASNGKIAWKIVQENSPDLILSDVIMPEMSGYELCALVKQNPSFSHIPVILLTAKTAITEQVEGLQQGADAYICKPFHVDYLMLTIKNLFFSRDRIRQYFSTPQAVIDNKVPLGLSPIDQSFMEKLTILLEQELSNPDVNIDYIARELGFSRTVFYKKIKGLTDLSPIDFLISFRLKRAAEMILSEDISFSEIAEKTGFSSYSYFSKSFKKHFGVSPKEYLGAK